MTDAMHYARITKSFLAPDVLAQRIEAEYGFRDVHCQLITATLRDVYLIVSRASRHILIVYRHGQRTLNEITAEWEFVDYLAMHNVPVAPAIPTMSGTPILTINAPEGIRYGVVTQYVPGQHLRKQPSAGATRSYGRIIATIHTLADEMPTPFTRRGRDIIADLEQNIAAIKAVVMDRPQDVAYLDASTTELQAALVGLPRQSPQYGIIHGDVIRTNALVSNNGTVTVIDFDLCGLGWRAYDVASYILTVRGTPDERLFTEAFLSGYTSLRTLSREEYGTLPLFEATRAIFEMGTPALNVDHWGSAYLYTFFDQSLERLKQSMQQLRAQEL